MTSEAGDGPPSQRFLQSAVGRRSLQRTVSELRTRRPSMALAPVGAIFSADKPLENPPPGAKNFSGKWEMDKVRSDDMIELLKLNGVPWVARKTLATAGHTTVVEHDGLEWTETISCSIISTTESCVIDGSEFRKVNPITRKVMLVRTVYTHEGSCITSTTQFPDGVTTLTTIRHLIEGDRTYLVDN
eukprot:CAMPEP_0194290638 /NCGR_PEP_ID=MMETSP0169-20130528/41703_1 /TAXON_ID=218684 /ORGANISM="Corethron pennatum, Strain L29A3" /LENGTH=186 /DNA_ID=CAMNT_0039038289 /DNA_START=14 /DNA_END=571 /DNA_ORIENTATION=-